MHEGYYVKIVAIVETKMQLVLRKKHLRNERMTEKEIDVAQIDSRFVRYWFSHEIQVNVEFTRQAVNFSIESSYRMILSANMFVQIR